MSRDSELIPYRSLFSSITIIIDRLESIIGANLNLRETMYVIIWLIESWLPLVGTEGKVALSTQGVEIAVFLGKTAILRQYELWGNER